MTVVDPVRAPVEDARVNYVQWGPAIAGALIAAAVGLVLDAFGAALGLAVSSTAPTWRDSSAALQVLSGLYLVLVAMAAFGGRSPALSKRSNFATAPSAWSCGLSRYFSPLSPPGRLLNRCPGLVPLRAQLSRSPEKI